MILAAAFLLAAYQPSERHYAGPEWVCGEAFALRLEPGERLTARDPGIDFLLYYAQTADGSFLIYEGNAPQPHDDEVPTGLSFPSVIAIHDNRSAAAKAHSRIRDRLLVGAQRAAYCPARGAGTE